MKLSLHRAEREPDWSTIPLGERNVFQRLAARTHGFVTPGNIVTLLGFGLSIWGIGVLLAGDTWFALALLAIGRLMDVFDGTAADKTGTKSHVGEILDATVDKIIIALAVIGMFISQVAPVWVLTLFVLPHVIIVGIVIVDRVRGIRLHPSRLGKTAALLAWLAVPLLLVHYALADAAPQPLGLITLIVVLLSSGFTFVTAFTYLQVDRGWVLDDKQG